MCVWGPGVKKKRPRIYVEGRGSTWSAWIKGHSCMHLRLMSLMCRFMYIHTNLLLHGWNVLPPLSLPSLTSHQNSLQSPPPPLSPLYSSLSLSHTHILERERGGAGRLFTCEKQWYFNQSGSMLINWKWRGPDWGKGEAVWKYVWPSLILLPDLRHASAKNVTASQPTYIYILLVYSSFNVYIYIYIITSPLHIWRRILTQIRIRYAPWRLYTYKKILLSK